MTNSNNENIEKKLEYLAISLLCFFFGLPSIYQDNQISREHLEGIDVTLVETPEFRPGKMAHFNFFTKEYGKEFRVLSFTLEALNKKEIKEEIKLGDKLIFLVKKEDVEELRNETFINNFNLVYGIQKGEKAYIDLKRRNSEQREDDMFGIIGILLGVTSLIYLIWGEKISISYSVIMLTLFACGFFIMIFLDYYNVLMTQ
ncbi:MAG: hypothetical protein AB8G86_23500 [Saprospiraceae bacterium]